MKISHCSSWTRILPSSRVSVLCTLPAHSSLSSHLGSQISIRERETEDVHTTFIAVYHCNCFTLLLFCYCSLAVPHVYIKPYHMYEHVGKTTACMCKVQHYEWFQAPTGESGKVFPSDNGRLLCPEPASSPAGLRFSELNTLPFLEKIASVFHNPFQLLKCSDI